MGSIMIAPIGLEYNAGNADSIEHDEDVFLHIKRYYGKVMYGFVLHQVPDAGLADEIFGKALQQLRLKKDLRKVLCVIEPWLAVFFHNFCQRELKDLKIKSELQSVA